MADREVGLYVNVHDLSGKDVKSRSGELKKLGGMKRGGRGGVGGVGVRGGRSMVTCFTQNKK